MPLIAARLADQRTRGYLYRVVTGAGTVALFYGLVSAEELAVWTGLVATLFVVPSYHTPLKDKG